MTSCEILLNLASRGVVLTPQGERLLVDAPAGVLTAHDRARLALFKPRLLALLAGILARWNLPPEWQFLWHERAAIKEHDGGLSREDAEAQALAEVVRSME